MIKAKLSLLQVPVKSLLRDPVEFSQASLGVTPERFNSVDMVTSPGKFVLAMMDSEMLVKTQVDQSMISSPAIGVNEAFWIRFSTNDGLKDSLARIRNNFGIDPVTSLQKTENDCFTASASSSLASNPMRPKIRFVRLQGSGQRRLLFTGLRKTLTNAKEDRIDGSDRKPCKYRGFSGRQIHCEASHKMPKLRLGNF